MNLSPLWVDFLQREGFEAAHWTNIGTGSEAHFHKRARQLFFVLSGELAIEVGSATVRLERGDSIEIVPGACHNVRTLPAKT